MTVHFYRVHRYCTFLIKKVKGCVISCCWEPISELRSVTCHMESHSAVDCHLTQVKAPCLNLSQADRYILDFPPLEGWKAELTLAIDYKSSWFSGLAVRRQSRIHVCILAVLNIAVGC